MSEGIQYEATNHDEPEDLPFSLTPGQAISEIIDY